MSKYDSISEMLSPRDDFLWMQKTAAALKLIGTLPQVNQDGLIAHWEDI